MNLAPADGILADFQIALRDDALWEVGSDEVTRVRHFHGKGIDGDVARLVIVSRPKVCLGIQYLLPANRLDEQKGEQNCRNLAKLRYAMIALKQHIYLFCFIIKT